MKSLLPNGIREPFARYAHGVEIPAGWRLVATSGQLGMAPDGEIPDQTYDQAIQCFTNIDAILAESGMSKADIVRISAFVTDRSEMAAYMRARDDWLMDISHLPASTLMIVGGFTRPEFKVEVEVLATAP